MDPVDRDQSELKTRRERLFHECMRRILSPLVQAGRDGVEMFTGDGKVMKVHPIVACYPADYPEQIMISCSKSGTCPKCRVPHKKLGDPAASEARTPSWTLSVIRDAKLTTATHDQFSTKCMAQDVDGSVYSPFWKDLPFLDIHLSLTSDVLHQLKSGVLDYLKDWLIKALGQSELDARIRALPPSFGVRHFKKGVSALKQLSASERTDIAKVLLACAVGSIPSGGVKACRALLDVVYLAQYKSHDDTTLRYITDSLAEWHKYKKYFIDIQVRKDFNIPKFHSLEHYVPNIELFGTMGNYDTGIFERLHIDLAKNPWRASNHRDHFPQMTKWLSRQEKMDNLQDTILFNLIAAERREKSRTPRKVQDSDTAQQITKDDNKEMIQITMAKYPPLKNRPLHAIERAHFAPGFSDALKFFINRHEISMLSKNDLRLRSLPFETLDVWTQFKLTLGDDTAKMDMVKAVPRSKDCHQSRFDTVVVLNSNDAESASMKGCRIGRVRVIFRVPEEFKDRFGKHKSPANWPKKPLAYVEWYSPPSLQKSSQMFIVKRDAKPRYEIVPLSSIRQACMLVPYIGDGKIPRAWTSTNVLDSCDKFVVNNWRNLHAYQTIY